MANLPATTLLLHVAALTCQLNTLAMRIGMA